MKYPPWVRYCINGGLPTSTPCLLIAPIALALLVGCTTTQLTMEERSQTYKASYTTTYQALIEVFQEAGYAVTDSSREAGIISTSLGSDNSVRSTLMYGAGVAYTANLQEKETGTHVMLTVLRGSNRVATTSSSMKSLYDKILNALDDKIINR